jgi:hypothetical protein
MLAEIEARLGPDDTLVVVPEGVTVNYFARRRNPTPFINFMPPELIMFGEPAMLRAFQANPPDWVLVLHKPTSEYGFDLFGKDYGVELYAWIQSHYESVEQVGGKPLQNVNLFGAELLRRK